MALSNTSGEAFVWGNNGERLTQDQIDKRRKVAQSLIAQGTDFSPVGHWTQGLARVASAMVGGLQERRLAKAEQANAAYDTDLRTRAFGGSFPAAPTLPGSAPAGATNTSRAGSTVDFANAAPGRLDGYLTNIRAAESAGNDQAKNPLSSATGRYQFIDSTWNDLASKYPDLGLTPDGRNDPNQQEIAIRAFTQDNAKALSGAGVPLTGGNLYAAHFLGAGDAQKVLTADPASSISAYVSPNVIKSNPFLQGMSVGDFSQWAAKKGGANPIDFGGTAAPAQAPVQVASLDPSAGMAAATAPGQVDPYGAIPAIDGRGEDQAAKFRQWNSDPIANEAANLQSVDPGMRQVIERAKQIAGTNFTIGSGRRDPEMQKKAVEWGWSKTEDSDHLDGGAVDLWPVNEQGQVVFDRGQQQRIAGAMKQAAGELGISIEAGADWKKFQDMPHFALNGLRTPMEAPIPTARPTDGGGVQVASLDPAAGVAQATTPQAALESMPVGQSMPMPEAASPSQASEPQQRVAQALMANQIPVTAGGTAGIMQPGQIGSQAAAFEAATSPYATEGTRRIGELLMRQSMSRQEAQADEDRWIARQKYVASQPNWQTQEVGGQVYRWNANDPNSKPEPFIQGEKPAPSGYQWNNGQLRPIAGGPNDPAANFKPDLQTIYNDDGTEQKGYFDRNGQWVNQGGAKSRSTDNGITLTQPDGTQVQIGGAAGAGGVKMPAGFMPDPSDPSRITPIPGGPGEQISGELAARIGVADEFLSKAPAVRERLAGGEASGPWDVFQARNNQSSPQAEVHRDLEYGVEALVRMLTGAGMNMSEANERARRYLPTYTDDSKSMTSKLDGLTDYLRSTKEMAMRGRGGKPETPQGPPPGLGRGKTSTGLNWSVR